jgi:hypothetical protein
MSSVVISGDTSGAITLAAPAVAGTFTQTLPQITGTLGTLNSGTAVASTSGTAIQYTSLPANIRRITIMFSGVSTNGSSNLQIQLGTGSTTYTTSGYQNISQVGANSPTNFTSGFVFGGGGAANTQTGQFVLTNLTSNTWVGSGQVFTTTTSPVYTQGGIALAAVLTAIQVTTVNGTDTFDAGSINILYE